MGTCKSKFLILYFFITFVLNLPCYSNTDLKLNEISSVDFFLMKYEVFILKYKSRIVNQGFASLMVYYQSLEHEIQINKNNQIEIDIFAKMNVSRYQRIKKYIPKITDCNIVRNKLLTNRNGYSLFTLKKNYAVTEELLYEVIKNNIYNISNINDKIVEKYISNTLININILHPIPKFNISCSGKITQLELD